VASKPSSRASHLETSGEKHPPTPTTPSSRLPGFYELPISERLRVAASVAKLDSEATAALGNFGSLTPALTDVFIENAVGTMPLPLGIATNFLINGKDVLVPMAVEETSVLAAASHGAKLARLGGGFWTEATAPVMTGQIELQVLPEHVACAEQALRERRAELIAWANRGHDSLIARGGGAKDLDWHLIPEINSLVVHLHVDTRDAMGANIVNTMCEKLSGFMPELFPCKIGLRILTNLTDKRLARARCKVLARSLNTQEFDGSEVAAGIERAWLFAEHDRWRATTNNKGVMNGIDPVLIATGNDWRAIEAGAHAWACRTGTYKPMASWRRDAAGDLEGFIELPMAVGTVGGVTKLHPTAAAALQVLGSPSAVELAQIIVAVGLAQNLSALRALATEGIQRGHMGLHRKNLDLLSARQGATRQ
jgi:hydroxymethylglutaryl-CoA reductase